MFNNLVDAISWVEHKQKFRPKTSLDYIKQAFEFSKIKLDHIKKIQVGGTNGKGSTCAFLSTILMENNLKVGTFTSPYLIKFNERIRINMLPIDDNELLSLLNWVYHFESQYHLTYDVSLSFFEIITLMAFKYFADEKVDVMVIEIGIGGLLDATSILNYDLNLIASVGFDHMPQLGSSLESIAENILGMLKPDNTLISTVNQEMFDFFQKYCQQAKVKFIWINPDDYTLNDEGDLIIDDINYPLSLKGTFQKDNALLALNAAKYLYPNIFDETIKNGLSKTNFAGRMEHIRQNIYIDGAHNISAVQQLVKTIKHFYKGEVGVIFSSLGDKEIDKMIKHLKENVKEVVICAFDDVRYKPIAYEQLTLYPNFDSALNYLQTKNYDYIIVTGSIHFIGQVKKELIKC